VNVHKAKTHLSKVLEQVMAGETIVVAKAGKPMFQFVTIGSMAGKGKALPGCWDTNAELEESACGSINPLAASKVAD
jgi:prevent-host-death family protein